MTLSRVTLGKVALAWAVLLWWAGLALPNLDSHAHAHPAVEAIVLIFFALLVIGTPIALGAYFNRAWRQVPTVSNRTAYVVWLSLETIAGAGLLVILAYITLSFVATRFQ